MFTRRFRVAALAALALIVALVFQVLGATMAHAESVAGVNMNEAATAVKIGGTLDPTSKGVAVTPADWHDVRIQYPASVPVIGPVVGQPTYDASTKDAIAKAVQAINDVPAGQQAVLMGNSQGADAALQAANACQRPVTVFTVGGPDGPGGAARIIPNLPGVTLFQGDADSNVYHVRYIVKGDGIAALRNPLEGGNAPIGTFANLVGYVLYHLDQAPDESYQNFRIDEIQYVENGEIWIMNSTHPFAKLAQMAGFSVTEQQKRDIEAFAPVGEPGKDSVAATPQQLWSLGAPSTVAKPATNEVNAETTNPVTQDPIAQAQETWQEAVVAPVTQAFESVVTPAPVATVPVETNSINAAAEVATQVAPQHANEIQAIEDAVANSPFAPQVDNLLAGLVPASAQQ